MERRCCRCCCRCSLCCSCNSSSSRHCRCCCRMELRLRCFVTGQRVDYSARQEDLEHLRCVLLSLSPLRIIFCLCCCLWLLLCVAPPSLFQALVRSLAPLSVCCISLPSLFLSLSLVQFLFVCRLRLTPCGSGRLCLGFRVLSSCAFARWCLLLLVVCAACLDASVSCVCFCVSGCQSVLPSRFSDIFVFIHA